VSPTLRPYQSEAIERIRQRIREGQKKVLVVAATGSGKTVVFSEIISRAAERGTRSLVLAHRRELVAQTAEKVLACGVSPGIIAAGVKPAPQRPVQVASLQTLAARPNSLPPADILIVDECHHHTSGNSYEKIVRWYPQAILLGFTATPWRLDGVGLADVYPSHVLVATPRELKEQGYLVPVGGFEYAPVETKDGKVSGGDFVGRSLEQSAMSAKLFGEIIGEWKRHAAGVRTVLFACTITHSMAMTRAFVDAGVPAEHLDGETPLGERAAILARVKTGQTRVLCNVNVATEGWDMPELECVILARPTLSTSLALQMMGRGLRPSPGKELCRIHDHARVLASHGHPYAERDWSPEKTVRASRKEQEAGVSRARHCFKCDAVIATYPCDACKAMPGPEELPAIAAAQRRAITDTPAWRKAMAYDAKLRAAAAEWARKPMEVKRQIYLGLLAKLGERGALGAYRRMSGESEWPARAWRPAA
jgi:superfamily II DNA or RNA helicase